MLVRDARRITKEMEGLISKALSPVRGQKDCFSEKMVALFQHETWSMNCLWVSPLSGNRRFEIHFLANNCVGEKVSATAVC